MALDIGGAGAAGSAAPGTSESRSGAGNCEVKVQWPSAQELQQGENGRLGLCERVLTARIGDLPRVQHVRGARDPLLEVEPSDARPDLVQSGAADGLASGIGQAHDEHAAAGLVAAE